MKPTRRFVPFLLTLAFPLAASAQTLEGDYALAGDLGGEQVVVEVNIQRQGKAVRVRRTQRSATPAPNSVGQVWAAEAISASDRRVGVFFRRTGGDGLSASLTESKTILIYGAYTLSSDGKQVTESLIKIRGGTFIPWRYARLQGVPLAPSAEPSGLSQAELWEATARKTRSSGIRAATVLMNVRRDLLGAYAPHDAGYSRDFAHAMRYHGGRARWSRTSAPGDYSAAVTYTARNSDPDDFAARIFMRGKGRTYLLFDATAKLQRIVYRLPDGSTYDDRDVGYTLP